MAIEDKLAALQQQGVSWGADSVTPEDRSDGGRILNLPTAGLYLAQAPGSDQAFVVMGAILGAYMDAGGPADSLGYPLSGEIVWTDDVSRATVFEKGVITWRPDTGIVYFWEKIAAFLERAAWVAENLVRISPSDAKRKVQASEGFADGTEWCGFTLAHIYKSAGMNRSHAALFPSTQGLLDFGSYYGLDIYGHDRPRARITRLKRTGEDIRTVHEARGVLRHVILWTELQAGTPVDIRPGDIVLVDHLRGGGPDHIQIAVGWDEANRFLTVVDGNGGGFVSREAMTAAAGGAEPKAGIHYTDAPAQPKPGSIVSSAQKQRLLRELTDRDVLFPTGSGGRVSISGHVLRADAQVNPTAPTATNPHSRVFAVIRPSAMDFEDLDYEAV